jgi:UbiA prenyltransferase family
MRGSWDRAVSRSPLLWLNLVCLDAPLVAICWQWIFEHSFHMSVSIGHRAALFLTAWIIYLADRFGDSVSLVTGQPKSVRQQFCLRHKRIWLVSIICFAVVDLIVVLRAVNYEMAVLGAVLGAFTLAYVAINHAHSEIWKTIPLKEFIIGSLFAAGTLLGVTPHIFAERSTMIFAAILFASLCSLNCVSIAIWERDLDRSQGKHSIATVWAHANSLSPMLLLLLLAGSVLLALFDPGAWPVALCLGASSLLLGALPFVPVSRDERTALADLALLTPLALFVGEKIL